MLLDGVHLVNDAIVAGVRLVHVIVAAAAEQEDEIVLLASRASTAGAEVVIATAPVMDAISPVRSSSAVVAIAQKPALGPRMYAADRPLVAIACDVQDPGNLGAITRVAEAARASGVVAAGQTADPFGWKALRGSMGSALRLPIASAPTGEHAVAEARRRGCRVLATVPRDGVSFFKIDLKGPTAVLV